MMTYASGEEPRLGDCVTWDGTGGIWNVQRIDAESIQVYTDELTWDKKPEECTYMHHCGLARDVTAGPLA